MTNSTQGCQTLLNDLICSQAYIMTGPLAEKIQGVKMVKS